MGGKEDEKRECRCVCTVLLCEARDGRCLAWRLSARNDQALLVTRYVRPGLLVNASRQGLQTGTQGDIQRALPFGAEAQQSPRCCCRRANAMKKPYGTADDPLAAVPYFSPWAALNREQDAITGFSKLTVQRWQ